MPSEHNSERVVNEPSMILPMVRNDKKNYEGSVEDLQRAYTPLLGCSSSHEAFGTPWEHNQRIDMTRE